MNHCNRSRNVREDGPPQPNECGIPTPNSGCKATAGGENATASESLEGEAEREQAEASRAMVAVSNGTEAVVPPPELEQEQEQRFLVLLLLLVTVVFSCGEYVARKSPFLTEGSFATLVGLIGGLILLLVNIFSNEDYSISLAFPNEVFFDVLLPPIIFWQGFSVQKSRFFKNSVAITLFGLVGTVVSFATIALTTGLLTFTTRTSLRLGAIMAATDSVAVIQILNPEQLLHSLVFGEGVVNDAASIVLLKSIRRTYEKAPAVDVALTNIFIEFLSSLTFSSMIGIAYGLFSAILMRMKVVNTARHERRESLNSPTPSWLTRSLNTPGLEILDHMHATHQVAFVGLLAYLSFFTSEILNLSGIMTLFVTGLVMSHYTHHNLEESAKTTTTNMFHALSLLAEVTIYVFVGMDCLYRGNWSNVNVKGVVALIVLLLLSILVSRCIFVFPICLLQNLWNRRKLTWGDMGVIVWAGMLRGAVSVALVMYSFAPSAAGNDPTFADRESSTVIAAVMALVVFDIIVLGSFTKPVISFFRKDQGGPVSRATSGEDDGTLALSLVRFQSMDSESDMGTPRGSRETPSGSNSKSRKGWLVKKWSKFDDAVMKPIFGGEGHEYPRSFDDSGDEETDRPDLCIKSENM